MRKRAYLPAQGLMQAIPSGVVIVGRGLRIVECNRQCSALMGGDALASFEDDFWEGRLAI